MCVCLNRKLIGNGREGQRASEKPCRAPWSGLYKKILKRHMLRASRRHWSAFLVCPSINNISKWLSLLYEVLGKRWIHSLLVLTLKYAHSEQDRAKNLPASSMFTQCSWGDVCGWCIAVCRAACQSSGWHQKRCSTASTRQRAMCKSVTVLRSFLNACFHPCTCDHEL